MDWYSLLGKVLPIAGNMIFDMAKGVALLEKSQENLKSEMESLEQLRKDEEDQVKLEVQRNNLSYTEQFKGWMRSVDQLNDRVNGLPHGESNKQNRGSVNNPVEGCSVCSLASAVRHSWLLADMTERVNDLKKKKPDSNKITIPKNVDPVSCGQPIVGNQETLTEILNLLRKDDDPRIIGIYGLGGVGKTTILEKIRYEFSTHEPSRFNTVVYAKVSRQMDIQKLRSEIAKELELQDPDSIDDRSLRKILARRRTFLILLDDVWEKLNLNELGIPDPDSENKSKVVLTTRSNEVCNQMHAQPIKVNLLKPDDAKKLFLQHLKNEKVVKSGRFEHHIDDVVSECGGLPLALITVGETMASKETLKEWDDARGWLMNSPNKLEGMEKHVFELLKFSYDHLIGSDCLKSCLLYCALFPDKFDIDTEEILEYWIGEGFLVPESERDGGMNEARGYGRQLLRKLIDSCLLEKGSDEENQIKMHDVVRDMALWIEEKKFITRNESTSSSHKVRAERPWREDAERISLMLTKTDTLPEDPSCPNLTTLLLNRNKKLEAIPKKFFDSMAALRVLDLSDTGIKELPEGIRYLGNLHHLNVSKTSIASLPVEVGQLVNLRQLNLSSTPHLERIPHEAISTLFKLWSLYVFNSCYKSWKRDDAAHQGGGDEGRRVHFEDLEKLPQLKEVGFDIKEPRTLASLLRSPRMLASIVCLYVTGIDGLAPDQLTIALQKMHVLREISVSNIKGSGDLEFSGEHLKKLEILKLINLDNLRIIWKEVNHKTTYNLVHVNISECHELKNLSWVRYFLSIQTISLSFCKELKDMIPQESGGEDGKISFERLREITLNGLPKLESICWRPMELLSAEIVIRVTNCPELKKLPLRNKDVKNIKEVSGQQQWWGKLQWETGAIKPKFRSNRS